MGAKFDLLSFPKKLVTTTSCLSDLRAVSVPYLLTSQRKTRNKIKKALWPRQSMPNTTLGNVHISHLFPTRDYHGEGTEGT